MTPPAAMTPRARFYLIGLGGSALAGFMFAMAGHPLELWSFAAGSFVMGVAAFFSGYSAEGDRR